MDKALTTQLANLQKRTGKTLDELVAIVRKSGLTKHGETVAMLKSSLGMGHGDANAIVHLANTSAAVFAAPGKTPGGTDAASGSTAGGEADLDRIYAGPRAGLRPIHERIMAAVASFGPFDIAPKKAYVSLRRRKQFATVGPATQTRVEVGLNMKGVRSTGRLEALPPGGMCQYRVKLTDPDDVDPELIGWIRQAWAQAE